MSQIFFNILSELFEAFSWAHVELEPEDVHNLKDLVSIFGIIDHGNNRGELLTL